MVKGRVAMAVACVGDVTMIPKSDKLVGVENLRPITILDVLHRLWAATLQIIW